MNAIAMLVIFHSEFPDINVCLFCLFVSVYLDEVDRMNTLP